jgi:CRP-like cAMP-binding protein
MDFVTCENCGLKSALVKQLNTEEIKKLEEKCIEVSYQKREVIFKEGAFSTNIIYLKKGLAKIHISDKDEEHIVKIIKAPSYIGIATTLNEKINQYSATALVPSEACIINIDIFRHFIHHNDKYAYEIIKGFCNREMESFRRCVKRSYQNVRGRIADSLLFFSGDVYKNAEFIMPISRSELGNYTDTSRESVCRILNEFSKDKLIKMNGKSIKILNEKILTAIANNG